MRIGILLHSFDETMGGIGVYTQEVVRALLRVDADSEYVLLYPGSGPASGHRGEFRGYKNAVEVEAPVRRLPPATLWPRVLARAPGGARRLLALLPRETYWDQVVVPRVAARYGLDVLFNPHLTVPRRGRFRKVTVLHNVEYHTVPGVYTWRMRAWWFALERLILPAADRVISPSLAMTADLARYVRYPITRVRTIHHGVSDKFRVETDPERLARARATYRLPDRFILFVGRLYPQKNFAVLARALALVRHAIPHRLVVVGRPRYKFAGDIALLERLGIADRVAFLHHVPNDDLPLVYNLADCFVYPSLYESFGLAQVEAMACGCPVIGANAGAVPEVAGDAALLFDPRRPEELAEAILAVTGNPDLRRDYARRGLDRARQFSWERTARQTLEVFRELAAS